MTWTIEIPHRTRRDTIADLGSHARALASADDRAVIRQLALVAGECGMLQVGEVIDTVKDLDAGQRRVALDTLRRKAGLPAIAEVEHARAIKEMSMHVAGPDPRSPEQCPAEGCREFPRNPTTWGPGESGLRRWWCPAQVHLAEPGDLDPAPCGMRLAPGGGLEPVPGDGIIRPLSTGAGWGP
jgi:hypothetical protein